jgi:hypothetical protein
MKGLLIEIIGEAQRQLRAVQRKSAEAVSRLTPSRTYVSR